jgi:hypothetical protein
MQEERVGVRRHWIYELLLGTGPRRWPPAAEPRAGWLQSELHLAVAEMGLGGASQQSSKTDALAFSRLSLPARGWQAVTGHDEEATPLQRVARLRAAPPLPDEHLNHQRRG